MRVITDEKEIAKLVQEFRKQIQACSDWQGTVLLRHQGDPGDHRVWWLESAGIWMGYTPAHDEDLERYWTAFGTLKPSRTASVPIGAEVNFPIRGTNRRVQGVFLADGKGGALLAHRGVVRGIPKRVFRREYGGDWITAADDDRRTQFAVVGELGSPELPQALSRFVREVERIKKTVR